MHKVDIPQAIVDRVMARRGLRHIHADLDPRRTALVVIDLQNGFLLPEGPVAVYVPTGVEVIPAVNRLAAVVRETEGKVFWVRNTVTENTLSTWSEWLGLINGSPKLIRRRIESMAPDSPGHQLHPDLIVEPGDQTVFKERYSAFIEGSSDLPGRLRSQGLDTVVIVGALTNVCCESSARDAMMLNFKTIMVSDANAAMTDEEHNAALATFYTTFGDVMDTDYLITCLRKNAAADQAAA